MPKILIDPGHYTGVNQSPVVSSYYEGNQMWKLSQYLIPALKAYGFEVGCTKASMGAYPKDSNGGDSVTTRGRMGKGYDFVLSLHSNAASSASVERVVAVVFVDDNCGEIDDISYELGKKLGEAVKETMGRSSVQMLQRKASGDRDGDGYVNDDFYGFLFGAHQVGVPAVLMEHGFHTHAATAQWLLSDANLKKLAEAEAKVIAEWFSVSKSKTGWQKDQFGWWYVHNDGPYTKDGFEQIDGVWYYFDCDGYMLADKEVEYNGKIYKFDSNGKCTVEEVSEVRYDKLKDITSEDYRPTIDKLIQKGLLQGKGGEGEERIIDLSEDTVRTLVILDRAGVFGE